jgi:hypothetical protein
MASLLPRRASLEVVVQGQKRVPDLRYYLKFAPTGPLIFARAGRNEIVDEAVEAANRRSPSDQDVFFYYRFQRGQPVLNVRGAPGTRGLFTNNGGPSGGKGNGN